MSVGYEALGFTANPFNSNTAEREPEIAAYAVHPPYLDRTEQASRTQGVFFLEGARGSGKSATRLTVAKKLFTGRGGPLVVPLTSFNVFKPYIKNPLSLDLFATQIAFLVSETLLAWLSTLSDIEKIQIQPPSAADKNLVSKFISNFYLNRSESSRVESASETYELIGTALKTQAGIWVEKRWDSVTTSIVNIASMLGKKYADLDIGDPSSFAEMVKKQKGDGFHDPIYTLKKAVEVARIYGFTGVLVQIDKVDETEWTGSDLSAAASLISPLLTNINLHEIEGVTWTFFVWDEVSNWIRGNLGQSVRFDKIPVGEIIWEVGYLLDLVSRRMSFFSGDKVKGLQDICEPGTDTSAKMQELIQLTRRSPRQLISALDHILSAHIQRNLSTPKLLDSTALDGGMDSFALKGLKDIGMLDEARTISKLGTTSFVTKDVQDLLRQGTQTARGRIDRWVNNRLVVEDGTRPTGGAGRPVDQFSVSDPRVMRIVQRGL